MKLLNLIAGSMITASLIAAPAVFAAEPGKKPKTVNMDEFMKACDMDHDGMMSKDEMLKHMEKMFDMMDSNKTGKLDKKKTEDFLKQLTAPSGA